MELKLIFIHNLESKFSGSLIADKERTMFTFDCVAPAKTIPYAVNQQRCRVFARKEGLKVYDVDSGIGSHILIDEYAKPGMTIVSTDSHFNIMGAISCFGQGMGDVDISYTTLPNRYKIKNPTYGLLARRPWSRLAACNADAAPRSCCGA